MPFGGLHKHCQLPHLKKCSSRFSQVSLRFRCRHDIWSGLSYLNDSFKPRLIVNGKDNIPLCQAIRLIQKDEVISAIYKLVTAESPEVTPIHDRSYSEKRGIEDLRKNHCALLKERSLKRRQNYEKASRVLS